MTLVRIVKNWSGINLLRQTPGRKGIWDGIQFTEEPVEECDYLLIGNCLDADLDVRCPRDHVWSFLQEAPTPWNRHWYVATPDIHRVYTVDPECVGDRYVHAQVGLPWFDYDFVSPDYDYKDYDFLSSCPPPEKTHTLSWVTSNLSVRKGHRKRLEFLESIRGRIEFDLFGRGFNPVGDKWEALGPYRYSLAVENHRNPYYWTEKIADCYLAWTMPVYCGCTRIAELFPPESMVRIDIEDPHAADRIREAIAAERWKKNLDAIAHARDLVLNRYQLFPFITGEIRTFEAQQKADPQPEHLHLRAYSEAEPRRSPVRGPARVKAAVGWRIRRLREQVHKVFGRD